MTENNFHRNLVSVPIFRYTAILCKNIKAAQRKYLSTTPLVRLGMIRIYVCVSRQLSQCKGYSSQ